MRAIDDFLTAIRTLKPTAIIGVAAVGGTFTQEVLEEMARLNERPIVFALSNPTSQSECTAEEAYRWTGGRALFACGSPFDPVTIGTRPSCRGKATTPTSFPGSAWARSQAARGDQRRHVHGRGVYARAPRDGSDLAQGSLYPALSRTREVSAHIAAKVSENAYATGAASRSRPANLLEDVSSLMYDPAYKSYI